VVQDGGTLSISWLTVFSTGEIDFQSALTFLTAASEPASIETEYQRFKRLLLRPGSKTPLMYRSASAA
jgi:hypothetical protein